MVHQHNNRHVYTSLLDRTGCVNVGRQSLGAPWVCSWRESRDGSTPWPGSGAFEDRDVVTVNIEDEFIPFFTIFTNVSFQLNYLTYSTQQS